MNKNLPYPSPPLSAGLVSTILTVCRIRADCVTARNEIGLIRSVMLQESSTGCGADYRLKADEQVRPTELFKMYEEQQSDNWRVQAIPPDAAWLAPDGMYHRPKRYRSPRSPLTVNHFAYPADSGISPRVSSII